MLRTVHHRLMQAVIVILHLAALALSLAMCSSKFLAFYDGAEWTASSLIWLVALEKRRDVQYLRAMRAHLNVLAKWSQRGRPPIGELELGDRL